MEQGTIDKKDLKKLIAAVVKGGKFYGPVARPQGTCLVELTADSDLLLEYSNSVLPVKRLFFPQSEVIASYGEDGMKELPAPDDKVVIFGVRPCDALSLVMLDKVFLEQTAASGQGEKKYVDPYYRTRRDNSLIISLACNEPLETCFCTSVGGSPAGSEGSDILVFDTGDTLLFEALTDKGKTFMQTHSNLFKEPAAAEIEAKGKLAIETDKKVPALNIEDITEKLQKSFESDIWDQTSERCLGCGTCTYLCPTCHCFALCDEGTSSAGKRVKIHDACMFPSFTLEASGHNPRSTRGERMRQRIMHKFRYTVENLQKIFCVGCGRCITNCPVNVDVRETIERIKK
ncbi:4Fe-4S dicluster domain-containing protein [Verrucomicrobiota bacterium]